jgi:adenosylmethionine---8-amino-7-oxononanoate aminotransferase
LEIWDREPVTERIQGIANRHAQAVKRFRGRQQVRDARSCGTILAVELSVPDAGYFAELGPTLNRFYLERNVLLRTLGNVVYVLPPYCITAPELDRIYDAIDDSLALVGS